MKGPPDGPHLLEPPRPRSLRHERPASDDPRILPHAPPLGGIAREEFGRALQIGGTADHVHGLILLRTDVAVADAMRTWKSLSSGWVHKTFPAEQDFAWQNGYAAFSVSRSNAEQVKKYIGDQESHHRKQTFEEEFLALLDRHGIEYDPRSVWD